MKDEVGRSSVGKEEELRECSGLQEDGEDDDDDDETGHAIPEATDRMSFGEVSVKPDQKLAKEPAEDNELSQRLHFVRRRAVCCAGVGGSRRKR